MNITRHTTQLHNLNKPKLFWVFISLISFIYLIVAVNNPISVLAWQGFDDMLFINHAQSLAEGRWLGKFDELTLVKGPGYPLFLAFNYWLGLPITITHAIFYGLSLLAISILVLKVSKSYFLAALLFSITLFDPRVFELSRIMRDAIYSGQVILIITFFSYSLLIDTSRKHQFWSSILSGLLLGWFWLTREEGIWLIPGLVFLSMYAAIYNKHRTNKISIITPILISIVAFATILITFSLVNKIAYGDFGSVDVKEKNFQSAIKAMESVRQGNQIPYLSVPRDVRTEIYKISPAFSELKKYIDPENTTSQWEAGGCLFRPTTCGDIGNGFFFWAVRDAAGKAGYYASPEKAANFYAKILADIRHACNDKRLKCESNSIPYMPPINSEQLKSIPSVVLSILDSTLSAGTLYSTTPWKIWGPEYTFNRAISLLNYPAHYPMIGLAGDVEIAGWYHNESKGDDWFTIKTSDDYNQSLPVDLLRNESNDLVTTFNDKTATHQRFLIKTRCSDGCQLTFSSALKPVFIAPLNSTEKYLSNGNTTLAFDYISMTNNVNKSENVRTNFSFGVRSFIHPIYSILLPIMLVSGFLTFLLSCFFAIKKSDYSILLAIAGVCWISITVRAVILILVDISSFPAITVPYMQPIFSLSLIASILSIGALSKFFRQMANIDNPLKK